MVEPVSVGLAAVSAYLAKDGIQKLLGPSADFLGGELKGGVEKSYENLGRVLTRAHDYLGDTIKSDGGVSPRVLKRVVDEALYVDDHLFQGYLAGILAGARSVEISDAAVSILNDMKGLSSSQIRFHWYTYSIFRAVFSGMGDKFLLKNSREEMFVFIPWEVYDESLNAADDEINFSRFEHCLHGLIQRSFLYERYAYGEPEFLKERFPSYTFPSSGIIVAPSMQGAALWLAAQGHRDMASHRFLDPSVADRVDEVVENLDAMRSLDNLSDDA